jgi:hypothetical protein
LAEARIDPSQVRFTQASVAPRFKDGGTIDDFAGDLRSGPIDPSAIPPIRIVVRDGLLFTLDNRRLEAFRRARVEVPFRMATAEEAAAEQWKFTTMNDGISVRLRGQER